MTLVGVKSDSHAGTQAGMQEGEAAGKPPQMVQKAPSLVAFFCLQHSF